MHVLHSYANQHHCYYQGMHEVCSYIMFTIEMDLFDFQSSPRNGFDYLLDVDSVLNDTYVLFEALMVSLRKCYEESDVMSNSVVSKIPYVARGKDLYNHIQAVPMSHEIYCAKWVRLMFSREVQGWRHVLKLWDVFFDLTSEEPSITSMDASRYTRPGLAAPLELGSWELDQVLEMTAASLIWLKRNELLANKAEKAVEMLVNYEPLEGVAPLLGTLLSSLHRVQTNEHMAPILPPKQEQLRVDSDLSMRTRLTGKNGMPSTVRRRSSVEKQDIEFPRRRSSLENIDLSGRRSSLEFLRQTSIQNFIDHSKSERFLINDSAEWDEDDDCSYDSDDTESGNAEAANLDQKGIFWRQGKSVSQRNSGCSSTDEYTLSLTNMLCETLADSGPIEAPPLVTAPTLATHIDTDMAMAIGISMAFSCW